MVNGEKLSTAFGKIAKVVSDFISHVSNTSNPHTVTKAQVGLGNVDNTSDASKPISTATQTALDDISATVSAHTTNTSNPHGVTKAQIGLGNVNNTADTSKPVSTAQQTAINSAYANANAYTDQKIAGLINGAPSTLDTLKEIADAMAANETVVEALDTAIGTKASQAEVDSHTGNSTIHITATERTNWNNASTNNHTHSNKAVIDGITSTLVTNWNAAYTNNHTHTNKTVLDGITSSLITTWNTVSNKLDATGASSNNTVTFTSADSTSPTAWSNVAVLATGEKHSSLFNKVSTMFKNIRWLYKMLGTADISAIGDGTVTGAISSVTDMVNNKCTIDVLAEFTGSTETTMTVNELSDYSELIFALYNTAGHCVNSRAYPCATFMGHLADVHSYIYGTSSDMWGRVHCIGGTSITMNRTSANTSKLTIFGVRK